MFFASDFSDARDEADNSDTSSESDGADIEAAVPAARPKQAACVPTPKRQKLEVPYQKQREERRGEKQEDERVNLAVGLHDLQKMMKSAKTQFEGGPNGLQARRTKAIEAHLKMVLKNGRSFTDASKRVAEGNGFAPRWGGQQLRSWTRQWIKSRLLPTSLIGKHAKTDSLLDDPGIAAALRTYLRSNKWAVNPEKLAKFSKNELIPAEAEAYLHQLVNEEMPRGLKRCMELELFPRIHLRVGHGISLSTARSHDAHEASWLLDGKQPLVKKGVGAGEHRSEVICSTVGHMPEAGESLEYGKNKDGFWNGERFVEQLKNKIIPTFENYHGAGYQALFLIDNSQGHSAYAEDALLITWMNINPGGKQARMRDGWFLRDGQKITQPMVFPSDHTDHPNQPKGIKAYIRDNCDYTFATLKANIPKAMASVDIRTIRLWENRTHRWIEAYRSGLDAKEAHIEVRNFSSTRYKSHRRVPERVAQRFD
ncbi:hypothetical protein CONPUDRAFT_53085 [Coniophora puteana RWD-64-598 SS2]|uniref:DDE-1 domain-containing protein n=1 Tax=Coniophora puteana (strain RWD-64-598) TaxID=741705 RepID=A0A5M3MV38_CONPW|nr:uncharacterized protein CONPUDRAFT_53085 [Coniophora puteana RWD-64-598 SS2]EIW82983.1 hypothetical protein CONPUDRAFT_53085 [Coniophora puteana RWD-64-598 SS2]